MNGIFSSKKQVATGTQAVILGISDAVGQSDQMVSSANTRTALSLESANDSAKISLDNTFSHLRTAMESVVENLGLTKLATEAQIQAAAIAGLMAGDYRAFMGAKIPSMSVSTESVGVVNVTGLPDAVDSRSFSLESYDERENKNAVIYSMAYNMQAARQDAFGETFFPTIVITPDNVGFGIDVNLMMVYDGVDHKITGAFEDFKMKNIIRAVANPDIMKKEATRIVPVHRAQSADKFVSAAVIPTKTIDLEGESIVTSALAVGKELNLLAISQTDALLASGAMDQTDSIDPGIDLKAVYVKVGDDILSFTTENLPLANFIAAAQGNNRLMNLNFVTTSVLVNKDTKQVDGTALVDTAAIVTNDYIVRLKIVASGSVNIETGQTTVFGNSVTVHSVQDNTGDLLDMTAGAVATLVAAINAGSIIGYDVTAYRTNMNRRQRGQLINTQKYTQLYNVRLRSPITAMHPINVDSQVDNADVQTLITATRIRTSNEAVTHLLNTAVILKQYYDARDASGVGPDVLGVGRFFTLPVYREETIDMNDIVDSIKSADRMRDIQAAIVNKVRDYAYRMYRDSEYKAAADALAGGVGPIPTVIVGTDPVIAQYLTVEGDLRTLGNEFDVRVVSTLDKRMAGKVVITFGVFDENRNVAPNPMNFGNMAWAPELVLTANISRGGTISKETVVQPRYLFITNLPILAVLSINNIPDVINKVPLNMHTV